MLDPASSAALEPAELWGEVHPLLARLGSVEGLVTLSGAAAALRRPRIDNLESLRQFLIAYHAEMLLPWELPAICRAYRHAARNQVRELIALAQEVGRQPLLPDFTSASRRIGQCQLKQLRPLRDARVVQRFLHAVESGQAEAWHTLVYGLTLAVYSLPLRQGLLHYARQTLGGFVQAVARPLQIGELQSRALVEDLCAHLPRQLEGFVQDAALGPVPR